jgi:thiamine-phosphate pyrophosphorylase
MLERGGDGRHGRRYSRAVPARYPLLWLFTDERLGDALWTVLRRLPPGSGVVFRHYSLSRSERVRLFVEVRRRARARSLVVVSARGLLPGAQGVHGPGLGRGLRTWPAHDRREAVAGVRAGATLLFVSPVFPTRSHPGAAALGVARAGRIGRGLRTRLIALGGMDAGRWRMVRAAGFDGWAGIDAWSGKKGRRGQAAP